MIPVLVIGSIAYGISYWICSTGTPVWRAIFGFLIGFLVGWVGGAGIAIFLLTTVFDADAAATTFSLLKNGIAWALLGAGYGVHRARKKLGNSPIADVQDTSQIGGELHATKAQEFHPPFVDTKPEPPTEKSAAAAPKVFTFRNEHENATPKPHSTKPSIGKSPSVPHAPPVGHVPDEAFAEALAEIEEGRLDKGAWARAFAESGGDESKAKAKYITVRAKAIGSSLAWPDTQPQNQDVPTEDSESGSRKEGEVAALDAIEFKPVISTNLWGWLLVAGSIFLGIVFTQIVWFVRTY